MEEKTIEEKIAADAYEKWPYGDAPKDIEDAKAVTGNSEVAAIKGIVQALGLDESIIEKLIGPKYITEDGKEEYKKTGLIYTSATISEDIASQIKTGINNNYKNKNVLGILSTIHDAWMKKNPDNFLKEGRNKERQFVPLQLLDWEEVSSDFVFLKPILEAAGIPINETELQKAHEAQQQEFFIENKIFSHEDLVRYLTNNLGHYQALEGLETINSGNIISLLQNPDIAEKMAQQIESRVSIKSREELAIDILKSDNPEYNEVYHIKTTENELDLPNIDKYISKREMLLSRLISKPYPMYMIEGVVARGYDHYTTEITEAGRDYGGDAKLSEMASLAEEARKIEGEGTKGKIEFGYVNRTDRLNGAIDVPEKVVKAAGLNPEEMGWEPTEKSIVTSKAIAKADQHFGIYQKIINAAKNVLNRIFSREEKTPGGDEK